jgi:hypothetical protein
LTRDLANKEASWPEFAAFDCASCHHYLRPESWRQDPLAVRPGIVALGRPTMPGWSSILLPLVSGESAGDPSLQTVVASLNRAMTLVPFGRPSDIVAECNQAEAKIVAAIEKLQERVFDRGAARQAITQLNELSQAKVDFHSQRQILWAKRMIELDLRMDVLPEFVQSRTGDDDYWRQQGERHAQNWLKWKRDILLPKQQQLIRQFENDVRHLSLDDRQPDVWLRSLSDFETNPIRPNKR